MKTFLEELAEHLITIHRHELKELVVVLPGKRAGIFLKRALHQNHNYSGWLPRICTLSEVLQEIAGLRAGDTLDLTFELFLTWKKHFNSNDSFNAFMEWGPALLNDFNEINHYLADPRLVYRNLEAYKELDDWEVDRWSFHPNQSEWSENQKGFADFWKKLGPMFQHFHERMDELGIYQGGTIARRASENPIGGFENLGAKHMVVAGLNALSTAEQKTLRKLKQAGKATMLWDVDDYYVDQKPLEAGHFLREWKQKEVVNTLPSHFNKDQKEINFAGCNTIITQMQYVHEVLASIPPEEAINTAVVLPDNSVLPALLPAIPEQFKGINITMGKSLSHTPYKSLLYQFFRLYDLNGASIRYSQLLPFLRHTLLSSHFSPYATQFGAFTKYVIKENKVFISQSIYREMAGKAGAMPESIQLFFDALFSSLKSRKPEDILATLKRLLPLIKPMNTFDGELETSESKERRHTWRIVVDLMQKMSRMYQKYPVLENPRDIERVLNKLFGKLQVDLIGEPLSGLQIMGLLEARSLDFKRVILLSCNEGVLPKQQQNETLLPFEIRGYYQLPLRSDRDAIFAYYFYRLIQRAKDIHLCYNAGETTHRTGEKSRYLQQLASCNVLDPNTVSLKEQKVLCSSPDKSAKIAAIHASEWSEKRLHQLLEYGISPSGLNKWLACPSDFYYRYILGLGEQDEVEEEMESSTFGTLLHDVLEQGYLDFEGKPLTAETIKLLQSQIGERLDEAIRKSYNFELTKGGVNYLICRVAERYLKKMYDFEISEAEAGSIFLEKVEDDLNWELEPGIKVRGKADRIDRLDQKLRIIDYKSGQVADNDLKIVGDFWEDLKKKPKAVQALIYSWMAYRKYMEPITAGLISARRISAGVQQVRDKYQIFEMDHEQAEVFEKWLRDRISEISLSVTPAHHAKSSKYCQYCVSLED